jgi:tRNA(fMet)-specific endonuclease VapC
MTFLLDTNACIYFLKGQFPALTARLLAQHPGTIKLSSIVEMELLLGAEKSLHRERTLQTVKQFLAPFEILPFNSETAQIAARDRAFLESNGTPVGPYDLLIAATAKHHGATLITRNVKEFARIPGLQMEDWTADN